MDYCSEVCSDCGSFSQLAVSVAGGLVPLQLHAGGDRRSAHLLHGGERPGRHGGPLPLQGAERHGAELRQGRQAGGARQAGL